MQTDNLLITTRPPILSRSILREAVAWTGLWVTCRIQRRSDGKYWNNDSDIWVSEPTLAVMAEYSTAGLYRLLTTSGFFTGYVEPTESQYSGYIITYVAKDGGVDGVIVYRETVFIDSTTGFPIDAPQLNDIAKKTDTDTINANVVLIKSRIG